MTVNSPVRSGPKRILTRKVFEWALWDWGSAAFNAVATTFVFSVYLTADGLFTDGATASARLATGLTIAGVVIALFAPVTGQRADRKGKGATWLAWFTFLVVGCMGCMFFVAPEAPMGRENALWLGIALLGLGNIFFEFASVNYNAMLNHLTDRESMGRVSGLGWGMGYMGGIVLLLILFVAFISPEVGAFGVTSANGLNIRVSMLVAALWFALSALPVILDPPRPGAHTDLVEHESLWASYKHLWHTVVTLFKEAPHTLWFLIASAVFRDGLAGVFTFGAIIASTVFGFTPAQAILFGVVSNVVAGIATIAAGALDDRLGPKAVIVMSLTGMSVAGVGVFLFHEGGQKVFWVFGLFLCIFVGPAQSASRSFLARMIPEGREGEVFGLYATTGRAVSFLAPAMYGLFITVGKEVGESGAVAARWGILGIVLILLIGLLLVLPVRQDRASLHIFDRSHRGQA